MVTNILMNVPLSCLANSYVDAFKLALDTLANEGLGVQAYQVGTDVR